jgi:N-acetylmuramoyl-L-alanine amidase
MPLPRPVRAALALVLALPSACGRTVSTPGGGAAPEPAPAPATKAPPLPPIPLVDGPLAINVVYPRDNQVVTSRDSNFVFGSIGSGRASLTVNGVPARVYPNGAFIVWLANPPADSARYVLVAARGSDTARSVRNFRYPVRVAAQPTVPAATPDSAARRKPEGLATSRADTIAALNARLDSLRASLTAGRPIGVVQLGDPSAAADTDRVIIARPTAGGTYKWFFAPGTVVPLVARDGGFFRVRLDRDLDVYVDSTDARILPDSTTLPRRVMANMKVRGAPLGEDLVMPIGQRAPFYVQETPRSIELTLYGVRGNTDIINFAAADSMIATVEWRQETDERARVIVNLRAAPYGYLVLWENGSMVLRLRGRPAIDEHRPLAGLVIAVDPGHPPIGATGPTELWEPQATLPIGFRLKQILEERGATVVMTRTTDSAVALADRPIIARKANVNAFVSIHLNALPDGINPFIAPGTGTYFFRPQSEPLARFVQRGMVSRMGLMDLGVNYDNLAVVRGTWYPAVLCEGAFIMMPDQEAALRTPEFQDRYARGVADGIEEYFRTLPQR